MQMNKAILRNSKIVIFDKKKWFRDRPGEFFFFQPAGSETDFFPMSAWSSIHEKVKQHWGWVEKRYSL